MGKPDTLEHIKKINEIRLRMEEYNAGLIEHFEFFLNDPSKDNIVKVYEFMQDPVASSSNNTYRHIRLIHRVAEIVVKELSIGYIPLTNGTHTCKEAIDRFRMTVFMLRRHELMSEESDMELIADAESYVIGQGISPVAIHDIIADDACFGDAARAVSYWTDVLDKAGKKTDALLLGRMI
ncbi:MAG: hypothetical protein IKT17_06510 [Lachnospiraceae bacterium]|nr:hypothetical protein [Lachnospiraceae bacterium]